MRNGLFLILILIGCQSKPPSPSEIHTVLEQWHDDAATGQLESYFDAMHEDGYFLGTDKTEVWPKSEFHEFSKPHFEDGKAWDFKVEDRNVFFTDDGKTAWFNEILETWMGPCRGSGVLVLTSEGWKIMQYNLTILVDNNDIDAYLKILESHPDE